jgi:hypothetical protein
MLYSIWEVRRFSAGLDHPEGIAAGRDDTLYAGGEDGQVYRISSNGEKVEVLANTGGFPAVISWNDLVMTRITRRIESTSD